MKKWNLTKKCFAGLMAAAVTIASIPITGGMGVVEASSDVAFGDVAFSFGVMSDLHLHQSSNELSSSVRVKVQRYANTVATLNQMASENGGLDALLLAGDYMNIGNVNEGRTYVAATREVLDALDTKNGKAAGTTKLIMTYGNHETEAGGSTQHMSYAEWEELLTSYQLLDENVVYGSETDRTEGAYKVTVSKGDKEYVFYSLETTSYEDNMFLTSALEWLREDLRAVTTANPNAYVYLTCHGLVQGSDVYGTDPDFAYTDWGSTHTEIRTGKTAEGKATSSDLYGVLKDFPQVVHFSGHTHFTNELESTIMSNTYTAISVAAMNEGAPGSGNDPYIDTRDKNDKGYAMLVEVDTEGRQRITRLEIDDTKLVQTTITYTELNEEGKDAYDDCSDVAASIVFPENSNAVPNTLTPWVMDVPDAEGSHLITYSQAARAKTPVFAENATLELQNFEIAANGTASFDVTFPAAACENYIIRYELTIYDQDGNEFDKSWMYGNWTKSYRKEVQGTERTYSFSYTADELKDVSGIYATVVAIDEFGGKSAPLTFGSRYELQRLSAILPNGGFENGLTGWNDYNSSAIALDNTVFQNGASSMAVTRQDAKAESVRLDVDAISPETEYTLTYAVNTGNAAAVKATVYEYSFHNKIVTKHETAVYGPTAVSEWKQGELTFTTSAAADKLGIVLQVDGAAGTVYVDDVLLVANGIETTQVHYDDYNGNGTVSIVDLVRMKRVSGGAAEFIATKYADRDGNGIFEVKDIENFRNKLLGAEDDFTGVIATGNAIGAKLEPVIEEELETISGSGVTVTETEGNVKLSTTQTISANYTPYMRTEQEYGSESFEVTADVTNGINLRLGARVKYNSSYTYSFWAGYTGVFLILNTNYFTISTTGPGGTGGTVSYNYVNGSTHLSGVCTFGMRVVGVGDTTVLKFDVSQDGILICQKEFVLADETKLTTAMNNETGRFIVWSSNADREFGYYIGEPKVEEPKDIAYLTTGGTYTDQTFTFTAETDYSNEKPMSIGIRMENVTNTPKVSNGLIVSLEEGKIVLGSKGWSDTLSTDFALTEGETYQFSAKLSDQDDGTKSLKVTARQGHQTIATATCSIDATHAATLPAKGAFAIWSADETRDVMYQIVQENEQENIVSEKDAEGVAVLVAPPTLSPYYRSYLALESDYTTEVFSFTTKIESAATPGVVIGLRKQGADLITTNSDGIRIVLNNTWWTAYADVNGNFVTHASVNYNTTAGNIWTDNTEYTFQVQVEGQKVTLVVIKDGEVISNSSVTLATTVTHVNHASYGDGTTPYEVPASGQFIVWKPGTYTGDMEIVYSMSYEDGAALNAEDDGDGGNAVLIAKKTEDTAESAYFKLTDKYTTEHFEVTTVLSDAEDANLQIGARMAGVTKNISAKNGVVLSVAKDNFAVSVNGVQIGETTAWTTALEARKAYTFRIGISGTTLNVKVLQGSTVVHEGTVDLTGQTVASSGCFAVWSQDKYKQIAYRLLSGGGQTKVFTNPDDKGTVLLKRGTMDSWNAPYFVLDSDSNYVDEMLEVTTTTMASGAAGLCVGLRTSANYSINRTIVKGIRVTLHDVFYQVHLIGDSNTNVLAASYNYRDLNGNVLRLEGNTEYTFGLEVSGEGVLTIVVKQEGKIIGNATCLLNGVEYNGTATYTLPENGDFCVWAVSESEKVISYKISE